MSATQDTNNQNRVPTPDNTLIGPSLQSYTKDPDYYYDDGNIVFLVGHVLFKVKSRLMHSFCPYPLTNYALKASQVNSASSYGPKTTSTFKDCEIGN